MPSKAIKQQLMPEASGAHVYGLEVKKFHTRLLRVSLVEAESKAYWEQVCRGVPREKRAVVAFEERWFGSKSMDRVRRLLSEFNHRYDAYPSALDVLTHWCPSDGLTRQLICHWHMQLSDPIYRDFTGVFLAQRWLQSSPSIQRDIVARWVTQQLPGEWSSSTILRMATGLIASAADAGLCADASGQRELMHPKVTDDALAYWMYFMRHLSFEGTLLENPYFVSVGLTEGFLEQRLRKLPSLSFNRMGDLVDFGWHYPDLKTWAIAELGLNWEVFS